MDFIEPCFGIGHNLSLICQMTSEDIKHQLIIIRPPSGFQARSRGGRWSWTPKLAQKRSRAGRWSWAVKVGLLSLRVVLQQQCNGHCLCDCPAQHLKQQLHSALVAVQWQGDTALTLPLFWRQSTVSPVFFRWYPWSILHSLVLFPPPPPKRPHL